MTTSSYRRKQPSGISGYWRARLQAQHSRSLPKAPKYLLKNENLGYLIHDSVLVNDDSECWTTDPDNAQKYYDPENAFRCAGILASITDLNIEVVCLD